MSNPILVMLELTNKDIERFWSKVNLRDEEQCWDWQAAKSSKRYGRFKLNGKLESPHVISYQLFYQQETTGKDVCHRCDNPTCVNPHHLFLGSRSDNMLDCSRKGRHKSPCGENNMNHKFSTLTIFTMRSLYNTGVYTKAEIGRAFGVSRNHLSAILSCKRRQKG